MLTEQLLPVLCLHYAFLFINHRIIGNRVFTNGSNAVQTSKYRRQATLYIVRAAGLKHFRVIDGNTISFCVPINQRGRM